MISPSSQMKRVATFLLLTFIATYAMAQTNVSKKTDRLVASTTLEYRHGVEYFKECIETFRYEGSLEGKRWLTGFYEPKFSKPASTQEEREEMDSIWNAYDDKYFEKEDSCIEHEKLFIVRNEIGDDGVVALTYNFKDTALILLRCDDALPILGTSKVRTFRMKVDVAEYDSIQMLHMLAVYTAVPMDPAPRTKFVCYHVVRNPDAPIPVMPSLLDDDSMQFYFVWGQPTGDLYARSHTSLSPTAHELNKTFYQICAAVVDKDRESLRLLMPSVHKLLSHYRTLLLPDVIVDGWEVDMH